MREIKFRGRRADNGEWVYGCLVIDSMTGRQASIISYADMSEENKNGGAYVWEDVDPETVGQFTGLKDNNGTEIYEGDIVRVYGEARIVEFRNAFWQLELCEAAAIGGFGTKTESGHKPLYRYPEDWIDVIGNIYEHPHLTALGHKTS